MLISVETEGFGAVSHQQDSEESTERQTNTLLVLVFFHYIFWQQKKKKLLSSFSNKVKATVKSEGHQSPWRTQDLFTTWTKVMFESLNSQMFFSGKF